MWIGDAAVEGRCSDFLLGERNLNTLRDLIVNIEKLRFRKFFHSMPWLARSRNRSLFQTAIVDQVTYMSDTILTWMTDSTYTLQQLSVLCATYTLYIAIIAPPCSWTTEHILCRVSLFSMCASLCAPEPFKPALTSFQNNRRYRYFVRCTEAAFGSVDDLSRCLFNVISFCLTFGLQLPRRRLLFVASAI